MVRRKPGHWIDDDFDDDNDTYPGHGKSANHAVQAPHPTLVDLHLVFHWDA